MIIYYFTGTGNSLYIAKSLCENVAAIPKHNKINRTITDDVIGFVYPLCAAGMPRAVKNFIKSNTFRANYIFNIATHEGMPLGHAKRVRNFYQKNNINLNYSGEIEMIDSYVNWYSIDEQLKTFDNEKLKKSIEITKSHIDNRREFTSKSNFFTRQIGKFVNLVGDVILNENLYKKSAVEEESTNSDVCTNAYDSSRTKVTARQAFKNKCESYYKRVQGCIRRIITPKRDMDESIYINPSIELREIIESNQEQLNLLFTQVFMKFQ